MIASPVQLGTYRSFAKINLHLQVVGRRADGYHELRTLFQSIDLHDLIRVAPTLAPGVELEVTEGSAPAGRDNLMVRAAEEFARRWVPDLAVRLELRKRTPIGGGLGGGSSNAATVLRALRDLTGRPERLDELWAAARELGADVPFFLIEGSALGFGRGDEVVPVPELPESRIVLAIPPFSVSTAEVFQRLPPPPSAPLAAAILAVAGGEVPADLASLAAVNDLETHVLGWYPGVRAVYNALLDAGARAVRLSGTGATLFAFFEEPELEHDLEAVLPGGTRLFSARTLSRKSIEGRRTQT